MTNSMWQMKCDKCNVAIEMLKMLINKFNQRMQCENWNMTNATKQIQLEKCNVTIEMLQIQIYKC